MFVSDSFRNELRLCLFELKFENAVNEPKSLIALDLSWKSMFNFERTEWFKVIVFVA